MSGKYLGLIAPRHRDDLGDAEVLSVDIQSVLPARSVAIPGVRFSAAAGSLALITGPNGSGKTVILRAIAGDLPYYGNIAVQADSLNRSAPPRWRGEPSHARQVEAVFHSVNLPLDLTPLEAADHYFNAVEGDPQRLRRLAALTSRVDLEFSDRPLRGVSRGHSQLVRLAVALTTDRPVVLLDEPLTSLDPASISVAIALCDSYLERRGVLVVTSHDPGYFAPIASVWIALASGPGSDGTSGDHPVPRYRYVVCPRAEPLAPKGLDGLFLDGMQQLDTGWGSVLIGRPAFAQHEIIESLELLGLEVVELDLFGP